MMRCLIILLAAAGVIACSPANGHKNLSIAERGFSTAERQVSAQLEMLVTQEEFPRTVKDGALCCTRMTDWTEGFFPGCLWYLYEHTGEDRWKEAAVCWTALRS